MAQSGFTPVSLYYSTTASAVPTAGNLANGELALNTADMKLYAKNSSGVVTLLASNAATVGVDSLSFGSTGLTPSTATTGAITVAGTLNVANGGTGKTSYTANGVLYASGTGTLANGSALTFDGTNLATTGAITASGAITATGTTQGLVTIQKSGTLAYSLYSSAAGTLKAYNNNVGFDALTLDNAGNLGLGVTPSASSIATMQSTYAAITGNSQVNIAANAYYNGGWKYYATGVQATKYSQLTSSAHVWEIAGSGTAGGAISFTTAMTLDASGNLLVGTTSSLSAQAGRTDLTVNGSSTAIVSLGTGGTRQGYFYTPGTGIIIASENSSLNLTTTSGQAIVFNTNSTDRGRFSAAGGFSVGTTADPGAGAIYATGNITAYYSDARLKTVSGKIENALDKVAQLSGVYYTNNSVAKSFGYDSDEVQVGVLAQDVEAVLPQIVKAAPFDLDENGNSKSGENYKTVQYERLVPLLIEAINELRAEVKALKGA